MLPTGLVVSYAMGLVLVVLYGYDAFGKRVEPDENLQLPFIADPADLTNRSNYLSAFLVYLLGLIMGFVALSLLGKGLFPMIGSGFKDITDETVPVLCAILLTGLVPSIPLFNIPERWWRKFMHKRALIPRAVQRIISEIGARKFSFSRMPHHIIPKVFPFVGPDEASEKLEQAIKSEDLTPISVQWLTLTALFYKLRDLRASPSSSRIINDSFFTKYNGKYAEAELDFRDLKEDIYHIKGVNYIKKLNDATENTDNSQRIQKLSTTMLAFIAAILIARPNQITLDEALQDLGFVKNAEPAIYKLQEEEWDSLITALGIGALVAFCFFSIAVYYTPFTGDLQSPEELGAPYLRNLASWLFSIVLTYIPIAFMALYLWQRHIPRSHAFEGTSHKAGRLTVSGQDGYLSADGPNNIAAILGSVVQANIAPSDLETPPLLKTYSIAPMPGRSRRAIGMRPANYAKILTLCFVSACICCLIARAINIYGIWHKCPSQALCSDFQSVFPITSYLDGFFQMFWLTPFVIVIFAFTCLLLFQSGRKENIGKAWVIAAVAVIVLFILNFVGAKDVYTSDEIIEKVTFLSSTAVFYVSVFVTVLFRQGGEFPINLGGALRL